MPLSETTRAQIHDLVTTHPVVLFMKGTRRFPQCGFSAQVVEILGRLGAEFEAVNVLSDPAIREGIKEYSSWPTIPQLYVKGEFVGGCDIVREMNASGELRSKLAGAGVELAAAAPGGAPSVARASAPASAPAVTASPRAIEAFRGALNGAGEDKLRLEVSPAFEHDLFVDAAQPDDVVVSLGPVALHLDPASASRADGVTIDFLESAGGGAFRVENPHAPPRVRAMTVRELKALRDAGEAVELFDVRTEQERATASIVGAAPLDAAQARLASLPPDARIVVHCHHGVRSRSAAEQLVRKGFRNVYNLEGGIEAWSREIDPNVPRY
jgi:monothiol glutaredoxin